MGIQRQVLFILTLLPMVLLLPGCGITTVSDPVVPPPITLANTAPGRLDAVVGLTLGDYSPLMRATAFVAVQFLSAGRLVAFQNGETLTCNGSPPQSLATSFRLTRPVASIAGKRFICVYTSAGVSATLQFQAPLAAVILSPADEATVARSAHTPITFRASGNHLSVVAFASHNKAVASLSSVGLAFADTNGFPAASSGGVMLSAVPVVTHTEAPAFASFRVYCTTITQTDVLWR